MATWKHVTDLDGTLVYANLDLAREVIRLEESTVIRFDADHELLVKELPKEICGI